LVSNSPEIDATVTYFDRYTVDNWQLINNKLVTVKGIRRILQNGVSKKVTPYLNYDKFELPIGRQDTLNDFNPFLLARSALHAPRDRFYKFRILHGDIYCSDRLHRFKMKNNPNCDFCINTVETIKHVLWDCPRAMRSWNFLNEETRVHLGREYINYSSVIIGNPQPNMAMETMITWTCKLLMSIKRDEYISNEVLLAKFKTLFYYEKKMLGINSIKMRRRWGNILNKFS